MKKYLFILNFLLPTVWVYSQITQIQGTILDENSEPLDFAMVSLHDATDNQLIMTEYTNELGKFNFDINQPGTYFLEVSYLGYEFYRSKPLEISNTTVQLKPIYLNAIENELSEVTITATRPIVEVRPDKTIFNVSGTINAAGENALMLLRKAPGVMLDNNENIVLLGRQGTLIYVDGKQLMLTGDDLKAYLQNINAEQIDRIDIITNPGAKYDAQGNAGIIDIRLKKERNMGFNGSVSSNISQGKYAHGNLNSIGNFRSGKLNIFGNAGAQRAQYWNRMEFRNFQNGLILHERHNTISEVKNINYRLGVDYDLTPRSTFGLLFSGQDNAMDIAATSNNRISNQLTPGIVDSLLVAENNTYSPRNQQTYNANYQYRGDQASLNIDLDYGKFRRFFYTDQPNRYYNSDRTMLLSEMLTAYDAPTEIDMFISKIDYEQSLWGGMLSGGAKFTKIDTDNSFLFYKYEQDQKVLDNRRSNDFKYSEQVSAAYASYQGSLSEKINYNAGVRVEHTLARGDLTAYEASLNEDPVVFDYTNFFPSLGLQWMVSKNHTLSLNYTKRINRPDYKIMNPFREQMSELAFSKGNPFLQPEIANSFEANYTLFSKYNFKLAYHKTNGKIVRLIAPDETDPRAGFITWDNLQDQRVLGANLAIPITITKWWNAYLNVNASYLHNYGSYEDGAVVDIKAFTYHIFQQQQFSLSNGIKLELSGWYAGPGVWEGLLVTESNFAINIGVQKRFFKDKIAIRLNASDLFFTSQWRGSVDFDGLKGNINGAWDSRRVNLGVTYDFGTKTVNSRKRQTSLDQELQRAKD